MFEQINKNRKYEPVALYWLALLPNRLRNFLLWEAAALPRWDSSTSVAVVEMTFGCLQTLATTSLLLLISSSLLLRKSSSFLLLISSSSLIFFSSSSLLSKTGKTQESSIYKCKTRKHTCSRWMDLARKAVMVLICPPATLLCIFRVCHLLSIRAFFKAFAKNKPENRSHGRITFIVLMYLWAVC